MGCGVSASNPALSVAGRIPGEFPSAPNTPMRVESPLARRPERQGISEAEAAPAESKESIKGQ